MENKQKSAENEGSSICSDLEQMNLADFGLYEDYEAKPNDGNAGKIEKMKAELVKLMKKEMETMKLASKSDSNEIANKLDRKIDRLEKYLNDQFQKLAQENQKKVKKEDKSLDGKLAKSEQAMGKLKKEIDRKNEKLAEKDKEIFALEVEIVGLKREIGQNDQKMEKKAEEICALKEEIGQKDQKLADQEAKISGLENEIAKLKQKKAVDQQSTIGKAKIDAVETWAELPSPPIRPTKAPNSAEDINKTEQKKAYPNVFGYCAGCEQGFLQTDWVRQVGDLQYHIGCFKCERPSCRHQSIDFDKFFLLDYVGQRRNHALGRMVPRILCKNHCNSFVLSTKVPITDARQILIGKYYAK